MDFIFNFLQALPQSFNVLRGRAFVITKWGSFFVIQSRASGITNQGRYYKLGKIFKSGAIITNQASTIYLTTENFSLKVLEQLNFCYINKEDETTPQPHTPSMSLVSLRNKPLQVFLVLEIVFVKFQQNLQEITHCRE